MSLDMVLEIKSLRKIFSHDLLKTNQIVLDSLNMSFPKGLCTGLMGHNGAGKTTTIRCIFGLIRPNAGSILFEGHEITREDKRRIGYMPETNKLPINLSCEEILWHQLRVFNPSHIHKKDYSEAIEFSLKEVGLWEHRKKRVGKLSKGMGRRLSWAQATIHKPELIILDEPMSGLDPIGYRLISDLILKLKNQKTSIIFCSHDLWSVEELCDHLHIIKQGKLVYSTLESGISEPNVQKSTHTVSLTGLSLGKLNTIAYEERLPLWQDKYSSGHRIDLFFASYSEAARWVQYCLSNGVIVLNFQANHAANSKLLLKYFSEAETQ